MPVGGSILTNRSWTTNNALRTMHSVTATCRAMRALVALCRLKPVTTDNSSIRRRFLSSHSVSRFGLHGGLHDAAAPRGVKAGTDGSKYRQSEGHADHSWTQS